MKNCTSSLCTSTVTASLTASLTVSMTMALLSSSFLPCSTFWRDLTLAPAAAFLL